MALHKIYIQPAGSSVCTNLPVEAPRRLYPRATKRKTSVGRQKSPRKLALGFLVQSSHRECTMMLVTAATRVVKSSSYIVAQRPLMTKSVLRTRATTLHDS